MQNLSQKSDIRENGLGWTLSIAKMYRFQIVAILILMQSDQ